jgi:hypothetical protein
MPQLIILSNGAKIIVGDTVVKRGWLWRRRVIAEDLQDGKACIYRQRDVMFTKEIPIEEWSARLRAEEEAQRKNPNPGNRPKVWTPKG